MEWEDQATMSDASGQPFRRAAFGIVLALALTGCMRPTGDQAQLRAIRAESLRLMAIHPIDPAKGWAHVPRSEWPPASARLQPKRVTVFKGSLDIHIEDHLDGGWGYAVLRDKQNLPMPAGCYSEPGSGVFWHGPC